MFHDVETIDAHTGQRPLSEVSVTSQGSRPMFEVRHVLICLALVQPTAKLAAGGIDGPSLSSYARSRSPYRRGESL